MATIITGIIWWGGALAVVISLLILAIVWYEPRMMLHHYPAGIRKRITPMDKRERRLALASAFVSLPLAVGVPIIAALTLRLASVEAFILAFGISIFIQLVDLVLIDWLLFCTVTPSFMVIPGTEGAPEYKDYRHHAVGFLKGLPLAVFTGLLAAAATAISGG